MKKTKKINWLHIAISWGASVVILGAMFKINHWGGVMGTNMIGLGLTVEALLFFTLGFFPPVQDPEWEKVYPELAIDYNGALPVPGTRTGQVATGQTAALDSLLKNADVTPEAINGLGEGLKRFTHKLESINNIADVSLATDDFSNKLQHAASKFDLLGIAFERASAGLAAIANSSNDANAYHQQVSKLTFNLSQLNSLYEAELNGADSNLRQINQFYQGLSTTLKNLNESADDSRLFKDEVNKLAKNISSLNVFYANMLSAMNQPRM
ncbi:gliding motility-associated protein GldL [Mucilaginibacter frigoritolerans]|uniref:Gliding motility-associated protein GldL n=1 Tax=Mucilaginibacter frigoritolerans TaxID=652788 RepID=A0A562U9F7_9SPHI|nr:gliding motility protein GldL [Mucilaginibacter frigoritolerans]TWJ02408.1 gliding motility-associated protein GldL [Mucilaginibacter frigoritolerans]